MPANSWRTLSRPGDIASFTGFVDSGDPFLSPGFLATLEASGAVGPGTAWQPAHLVLLRNDRPAALLPLYRKLDSRGEYVFDHAWAAAYQRHGLRYYPKLVTAIPFTPVPGPRLLLAPGETLADCLPPVLAALKECAGHADVSGWHGLFVEQDWLALAAAAGMVCREGCRFHWTNRGYRDFEDFLDTLGSRKRKEFRRERRRLAERGVRCRHVGGRDADAATWRFFFACYERTYHEHGQTPYLNERFFRALAAVMPERLSLVIAEDAEGPLACALFLHSEHTLYGRYWGSLRRVDGLHFEVCYYQGMELCLRLGLRDFDPGTQGEHKLLRGFVPVPTYSLHWLREPAFQAAISDVADEERHGVRHYRAVAAQYLPYRRGEGES